MFLIEHRHVWGKLAEPVLGQGRRLGHVQHGQGQREVAEGAGMEEL